MASPAIQFLEVLQNAFGQSFPLPVPDGQPYHFHVDGAKPGSPMGWYLFRLDDGIASGCYGSMKATGTWRSDPADP